MLLSNFAYSLTSFQQRICHCWGFHVFTDAVDCGFRIGNKNIL